MCRGVHDDDDDDDDDDGDDDDDDDDDDKHEAILRNTSCIWDCCYWRFSSAFMVERSTSANRNSYDYHAIIIIGSFTLFTVSKIWLYHQHSSSRSLWQSLTTTMLQRCRKLLATWSSAHWAHGHFLGDKVVAAQPFLGAGSWCIHRQSVSTVSIQCWTEPAAFQWSWTNCRTCYRMDFFDVDMFCYQYHSFMRFLWICWKHLETCTIARPPFLVAKTLEIAAAPVTLRITPGCHGCATAGVRGTSAVLLGRIGMPGDYPESHAKIKVLYSILTNILTKGMQKGINLSLLLCFTPSTIPPSLSLSPFVKTRRQQRE